MPDWYPLLRAARLMHIAPWELARQPTCWINWALTAELAECEGERIALELRKQDNDLNKGI